MAPSTIFVLHSAHDSFHLQVTCNIHPHHWLTASVSTGMNAGLTGAMTGLTAEALAAMARQGAQAPFYTPANAVPQLGEDDLLRFCRLKFVLPHAMN